MSFSNEKANFLNKLDKSRAGEIDKAILNLVNKINKSSDYYTTSSCAGRIILIPAGKKQENAFLSVWHDKISFNQLKSEIKKAAKKSNLIIYLKHEPCIMHVACRNLNSALRLTDSARQSGWKKSGIISKRNIIEMLSTEILAAPVAAKGKILVNDNYLKILANECNKKLMQTRKKIKQLEKIFNHKSAAIGCNCYYF